LASRDNVPQLYAPLGRCLRNSPRRDAQIRSHKHSALFWPLISKESTIADDDGHRHFLLRHRKLFSSEMEMCDAVFGT